MALPPATTYGPDLLGGDFRSTSLPLRPDARGAQDLEATLVRLGDPTHRRAVLYVHGFSDYFFQAEHARRIAEGGALDFYALDLRRYGRSLRPGHLPGDVRDLAEYDEELLAALAVIRAEGHEQVVLLGHSTGGLVTSLFVQRNAGAVDALVLNSPWFDVNDTALRRLTSTPLAAAVSSRAPERVVASLGSDYGRSIHASTGGAWDFDLTLKPVEGFPVRAGWLLAIRRAHHEVARGLRLDLPVLLCTSSRSGGVAGRRPSPAELRSTDTVLDVRHMWRVVPHLARDVTLRTVPGGLHDLALSAPRPRAEYEDTVLRWIASRLDDGPGTT